MTAQGSGASRSVGEAANLPALAFLLLLAAVLPSTGLLGAVGLQIAINAAMSVALALGLNIVIGYAGLLNIGYIAFFGIGAYLYGILASPLFGLNWPILPVVLLAAVAAGLAGIVFGLPAIRVRGDYLAIVTIGFGEIFFLIVNNAKGLTNGAEGIFSIDQPQGFGVVLTSATDYFYIMLAAAALVLFLSLRLSRSRIGRSWAAIRENEDAARACGIDTVRLKLLAFLISAAVAGAVGPVFAATQGYIGPVQFTLDASVLLLTMVIIGGPGSVRGVMLAAVLLTLLPEITRELATARMLVVGAVMVFMVVLRPQGIIPPDARPMDSLRSLLGRLARARSHA